MSSTKQPKLYALVDCNNFYASCERVFNPKLRNVPVVVLSNNDGCVIARSEEAKEVGIEMGVPYFQCRDLIRQHKVAVCSSNYALYGDMSARVMQILHEDCPAVQVYSIDESFVDFTVPEPEQYGHYIRDKIYREVGIPVSVGIGTTKTLAKVANKLAKKRGGVFSIGDNREEILKDFPVDKVWGIGRRLAARLEVQGILSAWDLSQVDEIWVRREMSVVGLRIVLELRGMSCLTMQDAPQSKQSICTSKSFSRPVTKLEQMHEALAVYTARAAEKLRKQKSLASHIAVFVVPRSPNGGREQNHFQVDITLPEASFYTPQLMLYAKQALRRLWRENTAYLKLGVILSGIIPEGQHQANFLAPQSITQEKQKAVMTLMDDLNQKSGKKVIRMASEGSKQEWQMQRQFLSSRYTTQWPEILNIKI